MAKYFLLLFLPIVVPFFAQAQGGIWTWMRGDGIAVMSSGNYGVQGIPDPGNNPPARYMATNWKDTSGNFWVFGGFRNNGVNFSDLWKYDPVNNIWTWVKGGQLNTGSTGTFGTQGVPNIANNPPANSLSSACWTDMNNHLWLYHKFGDIWRYDIPTNTWTWMKGLGIAGQNAVYGVQGIPSPLNTPGSNVENKATWVDSVNNLWVYNKGNVWRYSITNNEWTWMKGDGAFAIPVFGTLGVPDPTVQPELEDSYTLWRTKDGDVYLGNNGYPGTSTTLWKYHMMLNQWSWEDGDPVLQVATQNRKFISQCIPSTDRNPGKRLEGRGLNLFWNNDPCLNDSIFWYHGGAHGVGASTTPNNDLWAYNRYTKTWRWISGDSTNNPTGNYGVMGVPSPSNMPYGMYGHCMWVDKNLNVWVWGGKSDVAVNNNNMWRFAPDSLCVGIPFVAQAQVGIPSDTVICIGDSTVLPIDPSQSYSVTPTSGFSINGSNTQITFYPTTTTAYTVTANSVIPCALPKTVQFTIDVFTLPAYSAPAADTVCQGNSITLTSTTSSSALTFTWLPMNVAGSSVTVSPTTATTYTLIASWPGSGCENDTALIPITIGNISWTQTSTDSVTCFGGTDGGIQITASGMGTVNYLLMPGTVSNSTGSFPNLSAGNYTITATDVAGCSTVTQVSIHQPTPLAVNIFTSSPPSCANNNGTITASYTGGTGTKFYTLLPQAITNTTGQFTALPQGSYTVVVTDANGCTTLSLVSLVIPNGIILTNVITTPAGCNGANTGTATIQTSGGTPPLQYAIGSGWNNSPQFSALTAGTYTAFVTDTNSCSDSLVFQVPIQPPPVLTILSVTPPNCFGINDGSIQCSATSDTTIDTYQLQPGSVTQSNGQFTQLGGGSYTVTVTDVTGCSKTATVFLTQPIALVVQGVITTDILCEVTQTGKLQVSAMGGQPPLLYTLQPGNITNSTGTFENLQAGLYTLVVTDAKGCKVVQQDSIDQLNCCEDIYLPNAFTPNDDQMNDVFKILNPDHIEVLRFVVANRWGNLVFKTIVNDGWNGEIGGSDAAADTYYYFVQYRCKLDGKEYLKKGDVILVR